MTAVDPVQPVGAVKMPEPTDCQRLQKTREQVITADDLPLHCPRDDEALWCSHPKVFLPIADSTDHTSRCPYCGTLYRLVT